MGFFFSLLIFGILVAFNMFAVDTMMRMRTDIQIIRKALSNAGDDKKRAPPPNTNDAAPKDAAPKDAAPKEAAPKGDATV